MLMGCCLADAVTRKPTMLNIHYQLLIFLQKSTLQKGLVLTDMMLPCEHPSVNTVISS